MKNQQSNSFHWLWTAMRESAWAPFGVLAFYAVGLALHLYDLFPHLDIPSHLLGGMAITYFYRALIRNAQARVGEIPKLIQILFAATATGTTIIFWEFYENLLDLVLGTHMVKGLTDTIQDMALGLIGALLLTLFYRRD